MVFKLRDQTATRTLPPPRRNDRERAQQAGRTEALQADDAGDRGPVLLDQEENLGIGQVLGGERILLEQHDDAWQVVIRGGTQ